MNEAVLTNIPKSEGALWLVSSQFTILLAHSGMYFKWITIFSMPFVICFFFKKYFFSPIYLPTRLATANKISIIKLLKCQSQPQQTAVIIFFIYLIFFFSPRENIVWHFMWSVSEKIRLENSCELSMWIIHMKCQVLFSLKKNDTKKNFKMLSAADVTSALRDNNPGPHLSHRLHW